MDKQTSELTSLKDAVERLEAQHREMSAHLLRVESMCADMLTAANGLVELLPAAFPHNAQGIDLWCALRTSEVHRGYFVEMLGVFATEAGAVAACCRACDVVGRVILDADYGDKARTWPGAYYPLARDVA